MPPFDPLRIVRPGDPVRPPVERQTKDPWRRVTWWRELAVIAAVLLILGTAMLAVWLAGR